MKVAQVKLFRNGGRQVVRPPKACGFGDRQREVLVRQEGRSGGGEPVDEWSHKFRACLGAWPGNLPRPRQGQLADLPDPFA